MQSEEDKKRLRVLSVQQNVPLRLSSPTQQQLTQLRVSTPYTPPAPTPPPTSFGQKAESLISGAGSQLGGGLLRLGLRAAPTVARFTPVGLSSYAAGRLGGRDVFANIQRKGEQLAQESERLQAQEIARQPDQAMARRGMQFGTALKGTAEAALTVLPAAAASKVAQATTVYRAGLRSPLSAIRIGTRIAENVISGVPATVVSTLQEVGRGKTPNIAREALIGTLADAIIPVIGKGVQALRSAGIRNLFTKVSEPSQIKEIIKAVDNTLPENLVDDAAEALAKSSELEQVDTVLNDLIGERPIKPVVPEVPTAIPTVTPRVPGAAITQAVEATATQLAQTSDPTATKVAIDALFPNLDEATKTNLSNTIARTTDPEAVKTSLEQAKKRSDELSAAISRETPPVQTETQRQAEAAARLVEQPPVVTAPIRPVTEAPTVTPTPSTVQNAISPSAVQGAVEGLPERLVAQAEVQQQRYAPATLRQQIAEVWDPRSAALKIDRRFAKEIADVKIGNLNAIDRLEFYLMQSQQYGLQAQEYLANSNIAKVVQKYRPNTAEGNAFNTYRIFMRDLEQIADGRPAIVRDVLTEDKLVFVKQFENNNPTARQDLLAMVNDIEKLQDITAEGPAAFLAKADLDAARTKKDGTKYQFFTPVQRAVPDEIERAMVNSKNIGSLGQQRVLRDFTGSNIPVNPTYDSVTDYVATIYKQLGQSKVIKKFKERVEQGVVEGAEFIQTPEDFIKTERLRERFKELKTISVDLKKEIRKTTGKARVAKEQVKTEIAKLKTADVRQTLNLKAATKASQQKVTVAISRAKELLTDSLDVADVDARAAVSALTDNELLDLLNYMTVGELFAPAPVGRAKFKTAQTAQARATQAAEITKSQQAAVERIAKKGNNFARLVDQVSDMRMDQEVLDNAKKGIKQELIDLRTDPTTGLQIVAGRDINGIPFKIEVKPEYARLLQGLGQEQINQYLKLAGMAQKPFRQSYTGVLNPAFQVAQATWNAVLTPLLSKDGIRVYGKSAVKEAIKSFNSNSRFQQLLRANGAPAFGGGYFQLPADTTSEALAAQADNLSKLKWFANPKRAWSKLESLGGKLDNAARTSAAEAAYQRVLKATNNKEAALAEAIFARTQVLPDYSNLHNVIRSADSVLMYTGAAQSGTRTFLRALRERPGQTLGKMGIFASTAAAITAYNMAQDNGEEFYKDMVDSGKEYILDNNIILRLPGSKKDETTGEWSRVIKWGIPNELRPLNKAIRSTIYDGQPGIPVKQYAMSLFDFFTGNIKDSNNPAIDIVNAIRTGKDPRTGREIYDQTMDNEEKRNAILKYAQRQFGLPGKLTAGDKQAEIFINSFVDRVYGAKGSTEISRYYQNQDKAIKNIGINRNELDAYYGTVAPRSKDLTGNEIKDKTYYDSASKATTYLRYPKTFEVSKEINRLAIEQGKPGDPLYDLDPQKLRIVLNLMANYSPSNKEEKAIRELNPWIDDFNKKRSSYFDKIITSLKSNKEEELTKLKSEANPDYKKIKELEDYIVGISKDAKGLTVPKASSGIQFKLDQIKGIKDKKQRAQFYEDNPEVNDFYRQVEDYQRVKRDFMGLPQFDRYPTPTPEVQKILDTYNALPSENGPPKKDGTPSSPQRSAWIKAHPNEFAKMTDQWTKQDFFRLQQEGSLAVYEGLNFTEEGIKSLTDIAKSLELGQGFGYSSTSPEYKAAMAAIQQAGITVKPLSIVSAAPRRVRLQRQRVPTSRRTARIRLR